MYVRVIKNLSTGHRRGDIVPGGTFKKLKLLIEHGAVRPCQPAPLSELVGWTVRAKKLEPFGITDVVAFLEADHAILREAFNHKTDRAIERYKAELGATMRPTGPGEVRRR